MPPRQPFNDFLNSPGPSRGRGRGGGRGDGVRGRGRGRGGSFGGAGIELGSGTGGRRGGGRAGADYSNVPFNYDRINSQGYSKLEGFSVNPFGPSTPGASGSQTPRGRGRGRGRGGGDNSTPGRGGASSHTNGAGGHTLGGAESPGPPSGVSTPVTGLGYPGRGGATGSRGRGVGRGAGSASTSHHAGLGLGSSRLGDNATPTGSASSSKSKMHVKSTVGREGVTWGGGRGAPLFVKAGELFKDGEVDVVKMDENHELHVESLPLSDPSAPQMTDLRDEHEVEVLDDDAYRHLTDGRIPPDAITALEADPAVPATISDDSPDFMETEEVTVIPDQIDETPLEETMEELVITEEVIRVEIEDAVTEPDQTDVDFDIQTAAEAQEAGGELTGPSAEVPIEEEPLFFVDIAPAAQAAEAIPTYEAPSSQTLGTGRPASSDNEEIVFVPKTYRKPQPITIDFHRAAEPPIFQSPAAVPVAVPDPTVDFIIPPPDPTISEAYVDPRAAKPPKQNINKKAAKREKRARNKKGGKGRAKTKANGKGQSRGRRDMFDGSDIEWGSDGPPKGIMNVEGLDDSEEEEDEEEENIAVLKDYLAGTMLGAKNGEKQAAGDEELEEEEDEEEEEEEEAMDSDEVDEAIDVDMMRRFGEGMKEFGKAIEWNDEDDESDSDDTDEDEDEDEDGEGIVLSGNGDSGEEDDEDENIEEQWESASDSDASNSSAQIDRQLALALKQGGTDDDSDLEEIFSGKMGWENETEWFIRNMEDALDGAGSFKNRKSRTKLFSAIENGSFDDYDLPTEPAKKGKNKHIPPQLQAQWEKDRQVKADKKRQRALDRLAAELDPFTTSSNKFKNGGKGKGKGKGRDMAHAASLAHLIPASAADVAEMFDVSSDEDIPAHLLRKGRKALLPQLTEGIFERIDSQIRDFLVDDGRQALTLPPMDKEGRKKIHMLAECYNLNSKSRGSGKNRFTVMIKTSRSGIGIDEAKVSRLINASSQTGGLFYKAFYSKFNGKSGGAGGFGKGGKKASTGPSRGTGSSARAREGDQVGEGAEKIGMDNIGHRLLSKMGWAEGDRIGRTGGLDAPIAAIVKNTKSGLGA